MAGWVDNVDEQVLASEDFRRVLYTAPQSQLVAMTLRPGEDIGLEVHSVDQFLYIVSGEGNVVLDGVLTMLEAGSAIIVPQGTEHNISNTSTTDNMYLFTLYAPPEHADGTVHHTKADAQAAEGGA